VVKDLMEALKASLAGEARAPAPDDRVSVVRDGRSNGHARGHAAKRSSRGHAAKRGSASHRASKSSGKRTSSARPHGRTTRSQSKRAHR
jgi:hypothetical protein